MSGWWLRNALCFLFPAISAQKITFWCCTLRWKSEIKYQNAIREFSEYLLKPQVSPQENASRKRQQWVWTIWPRWYSHFSSSCSGMFRCILAAFMQVSQKKKIWISCWDKVIAEEMIQNQSRTVLSSMALTTAQLNSSWGAGDGKTLLARTSSRQNQRMRV